MKTPLLKEEEQARMSAPATESETGLSGKDPVVVWKRKTAVEVRKEFETHVTKLKEEVRERLVCRSQQLTENALSALFLAREMGLWDDFPTRMKAIWLICVVSAAVVQWLSTFALYTYLRNQLSGSHRSDGNEQSSETQFGDILLCSFLLLSYLMGELRRGSMALYVCWFRVDGGGDHWSRFLLVMFSLDFALHLTTAVVSVMGIVSQDNISDQLQAALSFFFILEIDEYMYVAFMQHFAVFEGEDDFVLEVELRNSEEAEMSLNDLWLRRSNTSFKTMLLFAGFMIFSGIYAGINYNKD